MSSCCYVMLTSLFCLRECWELHLKCLIDTSLQVNNTDLLKSVNLQNYFNKKWLLWDKTSYITRSGAEMPLLACDILYHSQCCRARYLRIRHFCYFFFLEYYLMKMKTLRREMNHYSRFRMKYLSNFRMKTCENLI